MKDDDNPYKFFRLKTEKTERVHLTEQELELVEFFDITGREHLESIVDKFLFSCYTGLLFSDFQNLEKSNFDFLNECYLTFTMLKVNRSVNRIPLHQLHNGKAMI